MFFQKEYIRENASMTLNQTYREDLPENGLLSSLLIKIEGDQADAFGQGGGDWRLVDKISKIEIIANGATIIKSLTGKQVQACAFYDQKISSPDNLRNYSTNTQRAYFIINFGRMVYDQLLGLDLSKFANVEIKVTTTATSSHFSALTISYMGIYLREPSGGGFSGYLRTEEWRSWTTVADATEYLDLPTEFILRRIILQAIPPVSATYISTAGIHRMVDDIELSLDTGVIRVYKGGIDDLLRLNAFEYKVPLLVGGLIDVTADRGVDFGIGHTLVGVHGAASKNGAGAATVPTMEADRNDNTQKPESREADQPISVLVSGMGYHNTAVLRFDMHEDPSTWLDPSARKTVKLDIKTYNDSNAASGTNKVILDRLVKY